MDVEDSQEQDEAVFTFFSSPIHTLTRYLGTVSILMGITDWKYTLAVQYQSKVTL